ncbi:hypothetical protein N7540_012130 [Penicillium herquei]|nr:hypothetical protein N7540_012130 [Penicillium herquei]
MFLPDGEILMAKFENTHVSMMRFDTKSGNSIEFETIMRHPSYREDSLRCSVDGTLITAIAHFNPGPLRNSYHFPVSSKYNVWNQTTGKPLVVLDGHNRKPHEAKFSTDNTKIVSTADDGTVRLWDLELEYSFDEGSSGDEETYDICQILRSSSKQTPFTIIDFNSTFWDLKIGLHQLLFARREYPSFDPIYFKFSPDRSIFFCQTSSGDHYQIIKTVTGEVIHQIPSLYQNNFSHATFSANNLLLAIVFDDVNSGQTSIESGPKGTYESAIIMFAVSTGEQQTFRSPSLLNLEFSVDGKLVALAFPDPKVQQSEPMGTVLEIRDAMTWMLVNPQMRRSGMEHTMTWSPRGDIVMIACVMHAAYCDGIQLWDLTTNKIVSFDEHGHATAIAFSPDDRYCAIDMRNGFIQLHDLTSMAKTERPGLSTNLIHDSGFVKDDWRFSEDSKVIETYFGRIDIQSFTGKVESWPNSSLFIDGDWVVRGFEKIFRLPSTEEFKCASACGDTLLVAYKSKRLEVFDFRPRD